jgi:hypothetical protein
MSTDRELLELAAKAAGMVVLCRPWNDDDGWFFCESHGNPAMHFRKAKDIHYYCPAWLPLTDDGDALRLAVKLKITPKMDENLVFTGYESITNVRRPYSQPIAEVWGDDPCYATRRAIVRRAAEIGKAMP